MLMPTLPHHRSTALVVFTPRAVFRPSSTPAPSSSSSPSSSSPSSSSPSSPPITCPRPSACAFVSASAVFHTAAMNPFSLPLKRRHPPYFTPPSVLHHHRPRTPTPTTHRSFRYPPSSTHPPPSPSSGPPSPPHPNWGHLSRQARHLLSNLPPPSNSSAHHLALESFTNNHPHNPFLWHALLTRLSDIHGRSHPPLSSVIDHSLTRVPCGCRGILYHFKVTILLHHHQYSSALDLLLQVIHSDPHPHLYVALAAVYTRRKHHDRARTAYRDGVKLFPRNPQLWRNWAFFEAAHGSKETALHTCREALDRDPSNPKAWTTMLQLQIAFGAGDAHLTDVLHEALTQCPADPSLRLQLARIEERRKGKRAAQAVLAPIADAQHPDVMRVLGRILFEQGDLSRGRAYLRQAADLDVRTQNKRQGHGSGASGQTLTDDEQSNANIGDSHGSNNNNNNNNTRHSSRRYKKFSRQHKAVKALHSWALMESKVGNIDEARTLLSEARSLCQTDAGIWRAIAELEARERNFDEARKAFQNALSIDPNDPRVLLAWGRTEAMAGDLEKAEALISKVDKLPPNRRKMLKNQGHHINVNNISSLLELRNTSAMDVELTDDDSRTDLINSNNNNMTSSSSSAPSPHTTTHRDSRTHESINDDSYYNTNNNNNNNNNSFENNNSGHNNNPNSTAQMSLTPQVLASALRERGVMASRDGRFEDALRLLTRASTVDPANETTWRLLASIQFRLHGIQPLRSVYGLGLSHVPQRLKYKLLHWWGQDERHAGHISQARDLFRRATLASPYYMSAWLSWGLLEKSQSNIDTACHIFDQATRRAEQDAIRAPFIFHAWGRIEELDRNRPDTAAAIFQRGTRLAPTSAALWTAWALLETRRADTHRARALFQRATDADAMHVAAWHSWALLEARRCNFKTATRLFESGHGHDPSDVALLAAWAVVEGVDLGNTARARDLFQRAIRLSSSSSVVAQGNVAVGQQPTSPSTGSVDPQLASCWREWGLLEMRAGNVNQARDLLVRASHVSGEEAPAWFLLGRLEAECVGDVHAATLMWKRVLQHDPAHTLTYLHWARMEAVQRGQVDAARALFRKGFEACRQRPEGSLSSDENEKTVSMHRHRHMQTDPASSPSQSPSSSVSTSVSTQQQQQQDSIAMYPSSTSASVSTGRANSRSDTTGQGQGQGHGQEGSKINMDMNMTVNMDKDQQAQVAALLTAWAQTELNAGDLAQARQLAQGALAADERHCKAWDLMASLELYDSRGVVGGGVGSVGSGGKGGDDDNGASAYANGMKVFGIGQAEDGKGDDHVRTGTGMGTRIMSRKGLRAALQTLREGISTCKGAPEAAVLYISAAKVLLLLHERAAQRKKEKAKEGEREGRVGGGRRGSVRMSGSKRRRRIRFRDEEEEDRKSDDDDNDVADDGEGDSDSVMEEEEEGWDVRAREMVREGVAAVPSNGGLWKALAQVEKAVGCEERSEAVADLQYRVFSRRVDSEREIMEVVSSYE